MRPARVRLVALLALLVPVVLASIAAGVEPGLGALVLATAAGGFAMLLAGPVFRVVLAVLLALLGLCVLLVAVAALDGGQLAILGVVAGGLQIVVGVGMALTAARWPASGSRYSRTRVAGDPASDWDALSAGDDPTDGAPTDGDDRPRDAR